MKLEVGVVCDRGLNPRRPVNQDRYLALPARGLFAVFDGVGGQRAGEVASQTAAETIEEAFMHDEAASPAELIRRAVGFANRDILELAESDPAFKTMATTVALLHVDGERATIAHVGDSRVYRLEAGKLYRETIDHTDLNDDIRAGRIADGDATPHEERNVINRALGVDPEVEVEIKTIAARDGVRFLLCSDGIYRHLSDEEIARILYTHATPAAAAEAMKRLVFERGADDNFTAVVVQIGQAPASAKLAEPARRAAAPGGRIQVEVGAPPPAPAASNRTANETSGDRGAESSSSSRRVMWWLFVAALVIAAFYAGLRASEFLQSPASEPAVNGGAAQAIEEGRAAFFRGDYLDAEAKLSAGLAASPQSAELRYWLGRAQMELGQYEKARSNFDQAVTADPRLFDAYLQAAAAYELLGDRARAAQMLNRYEEARKARNHQ